jgi:hypothetical protein
MFGLDLRLIDSVFFVLLHLHPSGFSFSEFGRPSARFLFRWLHCWSGARCSVLCSGLSFFFSAVLRQVRLSLTVHPVPAALHTSISPAVLRPDPSCFTFCCSCPVCSLGLLPPVIAVRVHQSASQKLIV